MKNWDGADSFQLYHRVVLDYEKEIEPYTYKKITINQTECVYVIQDTFIIYLGLINYGDDSFVDYRVVFEELLDNSIFKFNYSKFSRKYSNAEKYQQMEYKRFHGVWGEPIREKRDYREFQSSPEDCSVIFRVESRADYINETLPELLLKERYNQWEGYLYHFIIYELSDGNKTGYALYYTDNPKIHKVARDKANDVEYSGLTAFAWRVQHQSNELVLDDSPSKMSFSDDYYLSMGVNCDSTMIDLLCDKIEQHKANGWKHKYEKTRNPNKYCVAEKDLKYFWVSRYIKSSVPRDILKVSSEIFKKVHAGFYKDKERYEYLIPINKWKSEQLVYELTDKLYKKHTVLYQHHPFFLGKMSYDVFICGLNVAIEYQGKQHFEPVEIFGGEEHFKNQVSRDKLKKELSIANGVSLVYINYWEDISPDLIRERVEQALKERNQ